ncbi:hypothetical protein RJ639_034028 [Escallonia herrerae]|uniref:DNA polymerase III subunit gamma/tau n=1 Tax=Escallonia herrerae TaxID=1293975 RepID=A0AA88X472_9ASTE|nr:hypothetical protein RJ639_034028 [Escallonia herrerae]
MTREEIGRDEDISAKDKEGSDDRGNVGIGELSCQWKLAAERQSQEGLELVAVNRDGEEESMTESIRTLSQKYRPMFFEELIGQNIVVQSLMNAILRGRVASLYLFQGPRGTGKTSTARVLAVALNCLASNKTKPCGVCRECSEFILGNVLRQLPIIFLKSNPAYVVLCYRIFSRNGLKSQ